MNDGTSAERLEWQQTPEANAEVLLRTIELLIGFPAPPLAKALLHSTIRYIKWTPDGLPVFWLTAPRPHASTLQGAVEAYTADNDQDDLPLALHVSLAQTIEGVTGLAPDWVGSSFGPIHVVEAHERNQGVVYPYGRIVEHRGLRFRSVTETRVAKALDEMHVTYLPLPAVVRGPTKMEPDFLIIQAGRVGVLEVDGPHHSALTRAKEDDRADWFYKCGVSRVRHYSVQQVDADPKRVIREFLSMLRPPL